MKKLTFLPVWALAITSLWGQPLTPVHFSWGTAYFPDNAATAAAAPRAGDEVRYNGMYVRYLRFDQLPDGEERKLAVEQGLQWIGYVHPNTYLAAIPQSFDLSRLANGKLRSVMPVDPEWKLARSLREKPWEPWAMDGDKLKVKLKVYPHISFESAASWLAAEGVAIHKEAPRDRLLTVAIPEADLLRIAALPYVQFMERIPPPGTPEDVNGRSIHRSNALDSDSPLGKRYNGAGVRVLVRDDGNVGPHIDFAGRQTDLSRRNNGTHGDGVAGIMVGAGNLNPQYKGMAAGAELYVLNYEADFNDETLPLHILDNVRVTNSSYSDGCNDGYTFSAETVDAQLFDYPTLMHVFSAGNSNGQDCSYGAGTQWGNITGGHKMAKNAIATANLNAESLLESSSSRGPAHDGRLKPDIAAHGQGQISTDPNHEYQVFGGTSGAAPGIAGCMAQLIHAYQSLNNGEEPETGLIKAAMLNTANDMGNPGPDFQFGWGHINAARALDIIERKTWVKGIVDQGGVQTHTINIPNNALNVRFMLLWVDPPAAPFAGKALVNDLDVAVVAPGAVTHLPWLLDPTPDPVLLDKPAGYGRDSLNNMEQVAISSPLPGVYTVSVRGFEVPQGPQGYFLVWFVETNEVKLTYPSGGESLVPGETLRFHWDAGVNGSPIDLSYSEDGGATFQPIITLPGDRRTHNWVVPNTASGSVHFLLTRGADRDTTDFFCTITPVPKNVQVAKVCPDSITISYTPVDDTLSFTGYLLGDKYMEPLLTSDPGDGAITLPITQSHLENWVAVSATHSNGLNGRRSNAVRWPGGLRNCPQPEDAALAALLQPAEGAFVACSPAEVPVTVRVQNRGLNPFSGVQIQYQVNNNPVVTEPLPDYAPGSDTSFTFSQTFSLANSGDVDLRVWIDFPGEDYPFNDTLFASLPVVIQSVNSFFKQTFESTTFPPAGWAVGNPDNGITWARSPNEFNVTGSSGTTTRAALLNARAYEARGQKDAMYLPPVDLNGLTNPGLRFDVAHALVGSGRADTLRVELFPNCDINATPIVLWEKAGLALATAPTVNFNFVPDKSNEWSIQLIPLDSFAGQSVILRFLAVNDNGNNIWIDNVELLNATPIPPVASIIALSDTVCRNKNTVFSAEVQDNFTTYTWNFGSFSSPSSASGPGPHLVSFSTPGSKKVRLFVTSPAGADTAEFNLFVRNIPSAGFNAVAAGLTVEFSNISSNSDNYAWDFGDGNTSTEKNPVHTYAGYGIYPVRLQASSDCGLTQMEQTVSLTVGLSEPDAPFQVQVLPNPNAGSFQVAVQSAVGGSARLWLFDPQGRRLLDQQIELVGGGTVNAPVEGLLPTPGVYRLQVVTEEGTRSLPVVVGYR
ncbi:MAG: S8 family serine peptidase [Saprospiraceae bacterium]|nr:S8 family serine peptidase [Saprospiraceae bacterium]